MANDASNTGFQSVLAPFMDQFVQEKHACGYAYHEPIRMLHRLDDFLVQQGLATLELPRSTARNWLAKKSHESASTQQRRITVIRQFSTFLLRAGYPAYVPDSTLAARNPSTFVPRMLSDEELRIFFPGPSGGPFALRTVYTLFRELLLQCGIPHAGRGKGPRIHDYRHLFALHTLRRWYRAGEDLDAKLPLLATYLGHQHLAGTQRYLHLTAEIFPEITARMNAAFGEVIPRGIER